MTTDDFIKHLGKLYSTRKSMKLGVMWTIAMSQLRHKLDEVESWRPITTAPLDGTVIIIHHFGRITRAAYNEEFKSWMDQNTGKWAFTPSDWIPVPKNPFEIEVKIP